MSIESQNGSEIPEDEQLIALRQEFNQQGFIILSEWAGSIRELTDEGPFVIFQQIGQDGKPSSDEMAATFRSDAIGGIDDADLHVGKIFYLTAYQDPADEEPQLYMTFWKPREFTEEELAEIHQRADKLYENLGGQ